MNFTTPNGKIIRSLLFAVCLILLLPACKSSADPSKAPEFTLLNLQGDTVQLSDFKNKVVLINFFATYCPPCRAEIPDFIKLQEKYNTDGFVVVGISVDENGLFVLPGFVEALKMNYPVLLATSKVIKDYGNVYALPESFLLDREHRIIKQYTGMVTIDELEPVIRKALGLSQAKEAKN